MIFFVGIDWADQLHEVAITNEESAKLAAFRIAHTEEGVDQLVEHLRDLGATPVNVLVEIERPDGLLVAALLEQGDAVYPINPKVVERYRDRSHPSGAKDDARDALVLAHILRTDGERYRPLTPESDLAAELRLTVRAYRELVAEGVGLANHLHACLADYYLVARVLFSSLDAPISLAYLAAFPTPEAGIVAWLTEQGYPWPRRASEVAKHATAAALTAAPGVVRARSRQMLGLAAALQAVISAKDDHVRALEDLLAQHPDGGQYSDLPGAGTVTAADLLGELDEDREAVPNAQALQAVGGTAPVTIRSGKSRAGAPPEPRRHACSRPLHAALIQFARCSLPWAGCGDVRVAWVKEAYLARRKAGGIVQQANRVLAHRWAGILWAIWTRRELYDHTRYEKARQLRVLPKAS